MTRYIDADALKAKYEQMIPEIGNGYHKETLQDVLFELEYAPTISPDEVRGVGEWEDVKQHGLCRCSVCKDCYIEKDYITQAKWSYCPSCGTRLRMKGVSEDGK